jgi:hypothetical protein
VWLGDGVVLWPPAMSSPSSCKCFHCREFFIPCPNSRHTQRYCAKAECRKASKAAAQAKWLNKAENRSYFRGPENVERVQRWRERHPGYWRKKRSRPDALQDLALSEVSQNQPITLNGTDYLAEDFSLRELSRIWALLRIPPRRRAFSTCSSASLIVPGFILWQDATLVNQPM